ncbi:MAG: NADH-quinone oxidoreductase subunit N [Bacteroidota bacterium]
MDTVQVQTLTQYISALRQEISFFLPEMCIIAGIILLLLASLIRRLNSPALLRAIALGSLLLSGISVWSSHRVTEDLFGDVLIIEPLGSYFGALVLLGTAVTLLSLPLFKDEARELPEQIFALMTMALGMVLLIKSRHLLMLIVSLELISISAYLLTAFRKEGAFSGEASMKYLIFGAFSSALMIYGISWLYGLSGSLTLTDSSLQHAWQNAPATAQLIIGGLISAGILFKIGLVPFHFWAPDVYQAVSFPLAAHFSVSPKAAGLVALLVLNAYLPFSGPLIWWYAGVAVASMTLGNLAALGQQNIKRLLAFSSIAQAGYIVLGILAGTSLGYAAVAFYVTIYLLMNYGAFFLTGWLLRNKPTNQLREFHGLAKQAPLAAMLLTLCFLALTGLPPTAGFIAKWYVLLSVFEGMIAGNEKLAYLLLTATVLNTVVSLFYYLKVPALMVFQTPQETEQAPQNRGFILMVSILCAGLLVFGVWGFGTLIETLETWAGASLAP